LTAACLEAGAPKALAEYGLWTVTHNLMDQSDEAEEGNRNKETGIRGV